MKGQTTNIKFHWFSKSLLISLLTLLSILVFENSTAQTKKNTNTTSQSEKDSSKIYVMWDDFSDIPTFKDGGDVGMRKFINNNLKFPNGLKSSGKVYLSFTVDTLGNVKDAIILKGHTKETDEEALRVVNLLKFIPAKRQGKLIETKVNLPISFTVTDDKQK
ncbi:MAG: hypothetical protein A3F72_13000 [Bacteroidetes bacterium RIFCSPLOWO2_12_FULL_35_15]|nr:MAG: hypothetical protein A3F72_13000 [Bacteroidetes bacterium RIFCSPLOWO2_12_FULL_35_15]